MSANDGDFATSPGASSHATAAAATTTAHDLARLLRMSRLTHVVDIGANPNPFRRTPTICRDPAEHSLNVSGCVVAASGGAADAAPRGTNPQQRQASRTY